MNLETRLFGEIDIPEEKVLHFTEGIIGFPEYQNFTLIYDQERKQKANICWLQSMDDAVFALPVIDPLVIKEDYNPTVDDELLKPLGELTPENTFILVTVTVPTDLEEMSINLKAPIVINADTRRGNQVIVEDELPVKYKIYELLKARKAGE